MKRFQKLTLPLLVFATAFSVTGCSGTLGPASVAGVNRALGDVLPGARGATIEDQNRIDETVARGCKIGTWTETACDLHTQASFERRADLRPTGCRATERAVDRILSLGQEIIDQAADGAVLRELWLDNRSGAWTLTARDGERLCILVTGRQDLRGRLLADFEGVV